MKSGKMLFLIPLLLGMTVVFSSGKPEEPDILSLPFEELEERAAGSEVSFFMWGGSPLINDWVTNYAAEALREQYGITLTMVPINDSAEFVNKLATEKLAGTREGTADLIWINGENFKNAKEAELLFGPYATRLPHYEEYTQTEAAETDFGYPTEGYEAPYGRAQFVFEYDTETVPEPPESFAELLQWAQAHPGRFTYPQPPDFTGSAFIRQAFYEMAGGYEAFLEDYEGGEINRALFDEKAPLLWDYLNELEPYLWQEGKSYPQTITVLETLFSRGEVDFAMYYSPSHATSKILEGQYKETIRTFVMEGNSITNTHFTAIPFNAPNKAGALVVTNFLLSPEAQHSKADPKNWGDLPVTDYEKLDDLWRRKFDELELGQATLPLSVLGSNGVPEIPAPYVELLEQGWKDHVLND
ncbi:MAG: ABC transporter substrate-binding protein [Spirochaetales bacterium]|nr:ABC transporter substrate-binding protein [Spirochaetales bacterium]